MALDLADNFVFLLQSGGGGGKDNVRSRHARIPRCVCGEFFFLVLFHRNIYKINKFTLMAVIDFCTIAVMVKFNLIFLQIFTPFPPRIASVFKFVEKLLQERKKIY